MFCAKCGKELSDNASFCSGCGTAVKKQTASSKKIHIPKTLIFSLIGLITIITIAVVIIKSGIVNSFSEKHGVNIALKSMTEQMDSLSVRISCTHDAEGTAKGIDIEAYANDSAVVDFKNGEVHFSEGKTYYSLTPVPFDGTGHQEKTSFELYCTADDEVVRKIDNSAFGYVAEAEPLKLEECLWFFEDIKENINDAEITELDDSTLKITGELSNATQICDTYVNFIDLTGDGPEYQATNKISYELLIDKKEKQVRSICFDLSDIAAYVWYGSLFSQTGIQKISGNMAIEYLKINDADSFTIPAFEGREEVAQTTEEVSEEVAEATTSEGGLDTTVSEYILAGSDSRYISIADLEGFSREQCRLAKNEIYARHGRIFDDEGLSNYFSQFSWYNPTVNPSDFDDTMLNEYEIANRDLIDAYENGRATSGTKANYSSLYKTFLKNITLDTADPEPDRFCLAYIDEDDIPELLIFDGTSHANGAEMYTYFNNEIVKVGGFGSNGSMSYAPKCNRFLSYYGGMGVETYSYHYLEAGKAYLHCDLQCYQDENYEMQYTVNECWADEAEFKATMQIVETELGVNFVDIKYADAYEISEENIETKTVLY